MHIQKFHSFDLDGQESPPEVTQSNSKSGVVRQCRLCLKVSQETTPIFEETSGLLAINLIHEIIPELLIDRGERLSSEICSCCLEILSSASALRKITIENNSKVKRSRKQKVETDVLSFVKREPEPEEIMVYETFNSDRTSEASFGVDTEPEIEPLLPRMHLTIATEGSSKNKRKLEEQPREESQQDHVCPVCDMSFLTSRDCELHNFIHVSYVKELTDVKPTKFVCSLCLFDAENQTDHWAHLKTHRNEFTSIESFPCTTCNFLIPDFGGFIQHTNMHNKTVTHRCLRCSKDFVYGDKLFRHLRNCSDTLVCDHCDGSFKSAKEMQEHINKVH